MAHRRILFWNKFAQTWLAAQRRGDCWSRQVEHTQFTIFTRCAEGRGQTGGPAAGLQQQRSVRVCFNKRNRKNKSEV